MKGVILDFNTQRNEGAISGDDGRRYTFPGSEWRAQGLPTGGQRVDFTTTAEGSASAVFTDVAAGEGKSKLAAALLAFFLGSLGIHKFYLGYTKPGVIMLLCGTVGWVLVIPGAAVAIIAFIEFIIYILKSDAEFNATYVTGRKEWF